LTLTGGALVADRDEGIGLPPGGADAIFEPFGRAANAAARQIPGLGLGLYICRAIVARHHGRLWAESAARGGGRPSTSGSRRRERRRTAPCRPPPVSGLPVPWASAGAPDPPQPRSS
jgi:light-regulated signal transduction histidine kinase (bacteriophytochrome)